MDASSASAYSNLGILYSMMGMDDKAIENMTKGAQMFSSADQKRVALNLVGDQYRITGNYAEAIKAYQNADAITATEAVAGNSNFFTNNLFSSISQARTK